MRTSVFDSCILNCFILSGFSSIADFLAYAIVAHLMWPTRQSHQFLTHQGDLDYTEELDYYEDCVSQNESYNFTNPSHHHQMNSNNPSNHINTNAKYAYDNQMLESHHLHNPLNPHLHNNGHHLKT